LVPPILSLAHKSSPRFSSSFGKSSRLWIATPGRFNTTAAPPYAAGLIPQSPNLSVFLPPDPSSPGYYFFLPPYSIKMGSSHRICHVLLLGRRKLKPWSLSTELPPLFFKWVLPRPHPPHPSFQPFPFYTDTRLQGALGRRVRHDKGL